MENNSRAPLMEHMERKEQAHIQRSMFTVRKYLEQALYESQRDTDASLMDYGGPLTLDNEKAIWENWNIQLP